VAEASKWKKKTVEDWVSRGELVCAKLVERAGEVLKEAEAREEAEAKVRIMEGQCEEPPSTVIANTLSHPHILYSGRNGISVHNGISAAALESFFEGSKTYYFEIFLLII
jgi:hypothetical protein